MHWAKFRKAQYKECPVQQARASQHTNPNFFTFFLVPPTAAAATSSSFFNWLSLLLLTFFSLSGYNIVLQLTTIPLTLMTLVSTGTLGLRVLANFFTNLSEPVCERTANRFARTNSRFSTQPSELCDSGIGGEGKSEVWREKRVDEMRGNRWHGLYIVLRRNDHLALFY